MKFYLNWLKEYIDIDIQPLDLADKMTMAGVEVGECASVGEGFENVVTAEILKIKKHPNADKLSVCQVSNGKTILSVVCGASNIKEKDRVPLAMIGAVLPGGFKIKKSKIRGETSHGMLCSGKELQISTDAEGIYILPSDAPLGRELSEYLNLKDFRFELEITPNRGDLLGILGVAKEIGALTSRSVKYPETLQDDGKMNSKSAGVSVEIIDPELCPRYTAAVVRNVKIGESPDWMKRCLENSGIRPLNNIVDATNYVMMEWGQPMHAFDLAKIGDRRIIVRRAKSGEKIKTLDGEMRDLDASDLAICDITKPIAIGGVMGGQESEIGASTKDIVLESAYFDPRTVRKTSKKLNLQSESSYRFERSVNPDNVRKALLRAAFLIEKIAGGKTEKDIIDVYPKEFKPVKLILKSQFVEKILGVGIPPQKIKTILEGLGMEIKNYGDVDFEVRVPLSRSDITCEVDLIEEVARIYGYNQIPVSLPETLPEPEFQRPARDAIRLLENYLVGAGFSEVRTYSFIHDKDNSLFLGSDPDLEGQTLKIQNPISKEMNVMRQNILPSILRNLSHHRYRNIENLKIYEIDKTFHIFNHLCTERKCLALAITGKDYSDGWDTKGRKFDFYDVKGIFEEIAENFRFKGYTFKPQSLKNYLHPKMSADVLCGEKVIGSLGMVHLDILNTFELNEVFVLEIYLDEFLAQIDNNIKYKPFSKFPKVERDISLIIDRGVTHADILNSIKKVKNDLVKEVKLFDHYKGDQVPEGKKSLSYRIIYQSFDKTLTDEQVSKVHERIVENLVSGVKAELRK